MLNAENLTIWKDVESVMNADPKQFPDAQPIHELNYNEVIEMAYYGAQVIHPKTIKPLQNKGIPLYVKCFLNPSLPGTVIHDQTLKHLPPIIVLKENQVMLEMSSKDFSFVGEHHVGHLYHLFEKLKVKPNLTQNGAISFMKPANMGSSVGVSKASTLSEIEVALDVAFEYDELAMIEEAIVGREIEVAVLGNTSPRASLPGEVIPGHDFYDYDDKYLDDAAKYLLPAPLAAADTGKIRALGVDVFRALRCEGLARVDFFFEEGGRGFLCNEANTMPGFTPISMYPKLWAATGVSYGELLEELVALALERHGRRRRNTKR